MSDSIQDKQSLDVLGFVESTMYGVLTLAGRLIRTPAAFLFRPEHVWKTVSLQRRRHELPFLLPLTYFTLALLLLAWFFSLLFRIHPSRFTRVENPFLALLEEGVRELDYSKLLLAVLPAILALGLYSWCVTRVGRKAIDFYHSLCLASYFSGTVFIIYILAAPLMALPSLGAKLPLWFVTFALLAGSLLLKAFHSYLHLLRLELRVSRLQTLGAWFRGFGFFLILSHVVFSWFAPIAIGVLDKLDTLEQPANTAAPADQKAPLSGR